MYTDMFGKSRAKIGLHIHTTVSDGRKSPEEAAKMYKEAGFDAIAITDHWNFGKQTVLSGLNILPGVEFDIIQPEFKVFHIVCLCADKEPTGLTKMSSAQQVVDEIHACGGLAVLAHPAWSLNTPDDILAVNGFDATEIYNSVSNVGMSFRPDSSLIVDMLGYEGRYYPLLATDDTHYYDGCDNFVSFIMAECDPSDPESVKKAIKEQRFYASQGPEIHLSRDGNTFRVDCAPVEKIVFASNQPWCRRVFDGNGITSAEYTPLETERFIRAFVVDKDGKYAWSNIIPIK
ncbi:MAG: PHP domain-containing protein [Clostridia bacterium]|nr:PHP domain-containing protein [Clostridia bacterium]